MGEGDGLGVRESTWAREASGNPAHMGEPIQALGDSSPSVPGQAWEGKTSEVRCETDAALHSHLAISHAMAR